MKQPVLLALLAIATYFHFRQSAPATAAANATPLASSAYRAQEAAPTVVIAPAPLYRDRWKTGPNAQTDLKTGPNAQTDFEPFAPSEQANWNLTPGYTIVARRR